MRYIAEFLTDRNIRRAVDGKTTCRSFKRSLSEYILQIFVSVAVAKKGYNLNDSLLLTTGLNCIHFSVPTALLVTFLKIPFFKNTFA